MRTAGTAPAARARTMLMLAAAAVAALAGPGVAQDQSDAGTAAAAPPPAAKAPESTPAEPAPPPRVFAAYLRRALGEQMLTRQTLTNQWFGAGPKLEEAGITLTLNLWVVYQANVTGGRRTGQSSEGEYQLATHVDLARLAGLNGATIFIRTDGGWDGNINADVGGLMPVNGLFRKDVSIFVSRAWFEEDLLGDRLRFRLGKQNITDGFDFHGQTVGFDGNAYANSASTQFLNAGLVNNPAIAFPPDGLAAQVLGEPIERVYVSAALANSNAISTKTGISQAFGEDSKWMVLVETGFVTDFASGTGRLPGLVNAGYWYSALPNASPAQGFYLGMNQLVYREDPAGEQGFGVFARYGYADDLPPFRNFVSIGGQYLGLLPGRDVDVLGLGWAQAFTSNEPGITAPYEGVLEAYYRAAITPWFHMSPMLQFVVNPGGTPGDDAVVLGLRGQISF